MVNELVQKTWEYEGKSSDCIRMNIGTNMNININHDNDTSSNLGIRRIFGLVKHRKSYEI